ncbi:molybdenum cofactor guanylyltransferase MobA [Neptunomonas sp.]|uniref:molybdenum cofactor guanylyltransferase MobA n=1 Tax=Neptunomonas sp. TaxID=1971898 RepID=UPI00344D0FAD
MRNDSVTGVVLAGGMARRMGGTDKGWIEFEGKPLIQHALDIILPQVGRCIINANRSLEAYRSLNLDVFPDLEDGYLGPLMGMATGLTHAKTDWVAFVPCDSPRLPEDTVSRLLRAVQEGGFSIAVAHDGKRSQPVVALLHRSLLKDLNQSLLNGERKIESWFSQHSCIDVDFSDCIDAFVNVNRRDDLDALIEMPKLLGFSAWSGTGKTTLLKKLIPALRNNGVRLAVIKHAHHQFDVDHPGKDSYELRKSGANQMLIASANRWALMVDKPEPKEPILAELVSKLDLANLDLVLVEGFKRESIPKIELHRPSLGRPLLFSEDSNIIAIASDEPNTVTSELKIMHLADVDSMLAFVMGYLNSNKH